MANAVVTLYLDEAEGLKGPGLRQALPTGSDGVYAFDDLPEGHYYLAARKRAGNATSGPLREGDLFAASPSNPIAVRFGEEASLDVHLIRKEKDETPSDHRSALKETGLHGHVVDELGIPVPGVFVFAYRNRTIGHGMPDHISLPTTADGSFLLSLGTGGLFYVGARERTGGSPAPGERFGLYEGSPDHGLTVPKGNTIGPLRLTVRKVLEP